MGAGYLAQKTKLLRWTGDRQHPEWVKHNKAIDARFGQHQMRNEGRICVGAAITHNSNGKWFIWAPAKPSGSRITLTARSGGCAGWQLDDGLTGERA
jgi:hypothetical protein